VSEWIEVVPAYGRDYKNKAEVQAAWNAGLDFAITDMFHGGRYLNKEDAEKANLRVNVRYDRSRKVMTVK
jgi:hypothetical protein